MLIQDNKLNIDEFKAFFSKLDWRKVPRHLSPNCPEYFYVGKYEDDDLIIKAVVRPSKRMKVEESFKKRTKDGQIPGDTYRGKFYEFGSTVEVVVDDRFIEAVDTASSPPEKEAAQALSWS